jgi:hypothetical protein
MTTKNIYETKPTPEEVLAVLSEAYTLAKWTGYIKRSYLPTIDLAIKSLRVRIARGEFAGEENEVSSPDEQQ